MTNILFSNAESFRELQYNAYQSAYDDSQDEPCRCEMCGCSIRPGDEVELHFLKFACGDCIISEMYENQMDYEEALESLKDQTKK